MHMSKPNSMTANLLVLLAAVVALAGCGDTRPEWQAQYADRADVDWNLVAEECEQAKAASEQQGVQSLALITLPGCGLPDTKVEWQADYDANKAECESTAGREYRHHGFAHYCYKVEVEPDGWRLCEAVRPALDMRDWNRERAPHTELAMREHEGTVRRADDCRREEVR